MSSILTGESKKERAEIFREALRFHEEEQRSQGLAKKGLVVGDAVGLYQLIDGDGPRPMIELHTPDCRCERLRLPKYMFKGDVIEVEEGDRVPSPRIFRKLSDQEVEEATK